MGVYLQRQKTCTWLIEKDDKFRESYGLSTPSLDDIRAMKGVQQLRGASRKSVLNRLGVLERRRPTYRRDSRDYDRDRSGGYDRRRRFCQSNHPKYTRNSHNQHCDILNTHVRVTISTVTVV